jgi:hypothetical protein
MTFKQPDGLQAGRVFNAVNALPPDQAAFVHTLPFAEQERIVALDGDARAAAIAEAMKPKPAPIAPSKKEGK